MADISEIAAVLNSVLDGIENIQSQIGNAVVACESAEGGLMLINAAGVSATLTEIQGMMVAGKEGLLSPIGTFQEAADRIHTYLGQIQG